MVNQFRRESLKPIRSAAIQSQVTVDFLKSFNSFRRRLGAIDSCFSSLFRFPNTERMPPLTYRNSSSILALGHRCFWASLEHWEGADS
jgi:hypothetical protein